MTTESKTATRIYLVENGNIQPIVRLVRAANQAQALRHVAKNIFHVNVASQDDLEHFLLAGVKVENASEAE